MGKIGRNDPCSCGSGKKYKKCCLLTMANQWAKTPLVRQIPSTPELEEMRKQVEKISEERRKKLEPFGIYIDFVKPLVFKEKKVWVLGGRLYPREPKIGTFHEFIVNVLRWELGKEWWDKQKATPSKKQHFIYKCFIKHFEWQRKNMLPENKTGKLWRAEPDGWSRALISLAFDVCSLMHAVHLPDIVFNKLRTYSEYQGVRYEIAISAMFARMGYKIKFLDEEFLGQKNQPKHSEFIATNPETKEEIVIECKSKTRKGALHREGDFIKEREFRSSISKLYRHALKQKPQNKPFIIFIDMNLPLSSGTHPNDNLWVKAITKMRDSATFGKKGDIAPTNAIVFTNYSYHYGTDKETGSGEWLIEKSGNPEVLIKSPDFGKKFITVLHSYGKVPNIDITIQS